MTISILATQQIVSAYAAAVQAKAKSAISFVSGSLELARANAVAALMMWLQALAMQILALTRASTSIGADLDTWMADFGIVVREAAVAATGTVTFARFTATLQATIPVGTTIQTADGMQKFTVIADAAQPSWNVSLNAYVLGAGVSSIAATVQAVTTGTAGNINAATLTQITSAIAGVDTVTNAAPFATGVNAESDAALLARFQLMLQGLRSGIKASVAAAIEALQQGIQFSIVEDQTFAGAVQEGFFYVVIAPYTAPLATMVYSAVDAVRPMGINIAVYPANTLAANVAATVTAQAGYTHANVAAAVTTAIQNFIAAVPLGSGLLWSQLYSVAWGVPGVASVTGLTLNAGTADIAGTANQAIINGTTVIS
jgi:uncharacterized phage protein gp47/JayE